jgi:phage tail-like protein
MAVVRDRPWGNSNFLVDIGGGDSRSPTAGFAEVIFPPFTIESVESSTSREGGPAEALSSHHLVLKRGLTGRLDLYVWWNKARRGKAPQRRTVKIELLSEDHSTVVMTWRFRNVRPVSLCYSPLRALEGGVVIETVEFAFEGMEMS